MTEEKQESIKDVLYRALFRIYELGFYDREEWYGYRWKEVASLKSWSNYRGDLPCKDDETELLELVLKLLAYINEKENDYEH